VVLKRELSTSGESDAESQHESSEQSHQPQQQQQQQQQQQNRRDESSDDDSETSNWYWIDACTVEGIVFYLFFLSLLEYSL
jgi:hypothetical protein